MYLMIFQTKGERIMKEQVINGHVYRRFIVKGGAEKEQAAFALMERKGLSREDLILLLETYALNESYTSMQCPRECKREPQKN